MPEELDQGKVVAAIRQATGDVFSTMLGVDVTSLDPYRSPCLARTGEWSHWADWTHRKMDGNRRHRLHRRTSPEDLGPISHGRFPFS